MANIKRLKELSRMLKHHDKIFPRTGFNLGSWKTIDPYKKLKDSKKGNLCGTTACALGS